MGIWCLNTPTNEFDIFELSQTHLECDGCGLDVYIGDIEYETDPEENDEDYDNWTSNNDGFDEDEE